MSHCLHDLLYMTPICLIATILLKPYINAPKDAFVFLIALFVLGILTLLKHGKTRLKFIVPGVALAVAAAVLLIRMPENRIEYLWEHLWIAYSAGIGLGAFLLGWLWAGNAVARRILTVAMLGGLISDMILWQVSTKSVVALGLFLVVSELAEEVQRYWKKSGYPERKKHLVSIAPFLLLMAVLVFYIPSPEKPVDWTFVIKAAQKVSSFVRSHTVWLHNGEENYEAVIGFSDHGTFTDSLGDSKKEIMYLTVENKADGEIYLSGKTFDTFNGRSWSETYNEDNTDRAWDTMELLCAVDSFDFANTKDYIRRSKARIRYRDFYTNYCFAPPKAVPEGEGFDGIVYRQRGGNLMSDRKLGYGTEYAVSYYILNRDHERFKEFLTNPAPIEEKNWNRIKNQYSFTAGLNLEDYPKYQEKMKQIYLPETKISDKADAYLKDLLKDADTDYDKLSRIEAALSEMTYTWQPGEIPAEVDSEEEYLDYFLFDKKEGYCVHYATAFVLMARSQGIPARMVQGFRVNAKGGVTLSVKSDTGHAWAEAYLEGIGWLTFDPTPGERHNLYWLSAEERSQYASSSNDKAKNKNEKTEDEWNPETEPKKESKPFDFRFVYIPLAAVVLFVLLFFVFDRIIRAAAFKRLPDEEKFLSVCRKNFRILAALGYPMEQGETPAEFAKRVADKSEAEEYAFIKEYERVCYSDKGLSGNALDTAFGDRELLYRTIRKKKGKFLTYLFLKLSR